MFSKPNDPSPCKHEATKSDKSSTPTSQPTKEPPTEVDGREQPWKKLIAAEKSAGEDRPWVGWKPTEDEPFDKPWIRWSVEFGVDNYRHMSAS